MSILTIVILVFAAVAAIDYIFGSRLGLGKEFSHAFMLLGTMALSMIGMIIRKLISGVAALILAFIMYGRLNKKEISQ